MRLTLLSLTYLALPCKVETAHGGIRSEVGLNNTVLASHDGYVGGEASRAWKSAHAGVKRLPGDDDVLDTEKRGKNKDLLSTRHEMHNKSIMREEAPKQRQLCRPRISRREIDLAARERKHDRDVEWHHNQPKRSAHLHCCAPDMDIPDTVGLSPRSMLMPRILLL